MALSVAAPGALVSDPSQSHQANIIVCAILSWMIATGFVAVRFYTRWRIVYVLGVEDWMLLVALILSGLNMAATIRQAFYGLGKHDGDIPPGNMAPLLQANWMSLLWYGLSLNATEISILLLYIRILSYQHIKHAAYTMLVLVVVFTVWLVVSLLTACIPLQAYWDQSVQASFCWPQSVWWTSMGVHMVTDFVIILLPLPVIFRLRIRWQEKLLLYCLFTFGFFVCIAAVLRLVAFLQFETQTDTSYTSNAISYWTCIEPNTAIVCACVMTLKPLITRCCPYFRELNRIGNEAPAWADPRRKKGPGLGRGPGSGPAHVDAQGRPLTIGSKPVRRPWGRQLRDAERDSVDVEMGAHDRFDCGMTSPSQTAILGHHAHAHGRGHEDDEDGDGDGDGDDDRHDGESVQLDDLKGGGGPRGSHAPDHDSKAAAGRDKGGEEDGKEPSISWPFRPPKARLRAAAASLRQSPPAPSDAWADRVDMYSEELRGRPDPGRTFYIP